jgi:hypothetical protein
VSSLVYPRPLTFPVEFSNSASSLLIFVNNATACAGDLMGELYALVWSIAIGGGIPRHLRLSLRAVREKFN